MKAHLQCFFPFAIESADLVFSVRCSALDSHSGVSLDSMRLGYLRKAPHETLLTSSRERFGAGGAELAGRFFFTPESSNCQSCHEQRLIYTFSASLPRGRAPHIHMRAAGGELHRYQIAG